MSEKKSLNEVVGDDEKTQEINVKVHVKKPVDRIDVTVKVDDEEQTEGTSSGKQLLTED